VTYAKRTDANQTEICAALRKVGATVQDLSRVGGGCPDLLVGYRGENYLMEVKVKTGRLRQSQIEFQKTWDGDDVFVVRSVDDALIAVGAMERPTVIIKRHGEVK